MKKGTKRFLFLTTAAIAGMCGYNYFIATHATKNNLLSTANGDFYETKHGDIFYTKQGSGSPLLLIHDANPRSSAYEWNMIIKRLEKQYTVYTIDLLGCGRSDKPGYNYTNFLYVQILNEFIENVIGEKTSVVATNMSCGFVTMTNQMNPELFEKIVFINPVSAKKMEMIPDTLSKAKQTLYSIPILGTFIYNLQNNPIHIDLAFREKYYHNAQLISNKAKDTYYESAHIGESAGRFLFGSLLGNYLNINIKQAVKNIKVPTYIIASREIRNNVQTAEEYHRLNNGIEVTMVSNSSLYPQMEIPEKIANIIREKI